MYEGGLPRPQKASVLAASHGDRRTEDAQSRQLGCCAQADRTRPTPATEKHFTIPQVAQMWSMSETTARRLFEEEEGVLRVGLPSRRVARKLKRTYITLYVPESVLNKVHARLSRKPS
jgi:AraC-like DNA-binding protein